eukprot:1160274-Pelagomonas_calceolata.AAC.10
MAVMAGRGGARMSNCTDCTAQVLLYQSTSAVGCFLCWGKELSSSGQQALSQAGSVRQCASRAGGQRGTQIFKIYNLHSCKEKCRVRQQFSQGEREEYSARTHIHTHTFGVSKN